MVFVLRFKRRKFWFWSKLKAKGVQVVEKDRLIVYLPKGGVYEIPEWSKHYCKLGKDWEKATEKIMQNQAGQPINLKTDS